MGLRLSKKRVYPPPSASRVCLSIRTCILDLSPLDPPVHEAGVACLLAKAR